MKLHSCTFPRDDTLVCVARGRSKKQTTSGHLTPVCQVFALSPIYTSAQYGDFQVRLPATCPSAAGTTSSRDLNWSILSVLRGSLPRKRLWIKSVSCCPFSSPEFAFRRCSTEGQWEGQAANTTNTVGWTNYTLCFSKEMAELINKLNNKEGQVGDRKAINLIILPLG